MNKTQQPDGNSKFYARGRITCKLKHVKFTKTVKTPTKFPKIHLFLVSMNVPAAISKIIALVSEELWAKGLESYNRKRQQSITKPTTRSSVRFFPSVGNVVSRKGFHLAFLYWFIELELALWRFFYVVFSFYFLSC